VGWRDGGVGEGVRRVLGGRVGSGRLSPAQRFARGGLAGDGRAAWGVLGDGFAAVLRGWRRVDESGRLVAEIADYETIRQLCSGLFADSVTEGASARVREAVAGVFELYAERAQGENVTVAKVAKRLGLSRSAATRRLAMAIAMGWVVNSEHRQKHPWVLEPGEPMPETSVLPVLRAGTGDESAGAPDTGRDDRADLEPWQQSILEEYDL